MTAPTRHIRELDVPAAEVERRIAKQHVDAREERLQLLIAHPETAHKSAQPGELAEYRHLLHDADPDSITRPFPDLAKGTPWRVS